MEWSGLGWDLGWVVVEGGWRSAASGTNASDVGTDGETRRKNGKKGFFFLLFFSELDKS